MTAEWIHPILRLRGSLTRDYYVRLLRGKQVVQRKPRKPMSPRKAAACKAFGERFGTARKKKS